MRMDINFLDEILKDEMPKSTRVKLDKNGEGPYSKPRQEWAGLTELPPDFYEQTKIYLRNLEQSAIESKGRERDFMNREVLNANLIIDGIVNRRLAKITDLASICADGCSGDSIDHNIRNMLPNELSLFESLKNSLLEFRLGVKFECQPIKSPSGMIAPLSSQ